jgi:hypothetical protein
VLLLAVWGAWELKVGCAVSFFCMQLLTCTSPYNAAKPCTC